MLPSARARTGHPLYGLFAHSYRHFYPWGTPPKSIHRGPNHTSGPLGTIKITLLASWRPIYAQFRPFTCARTGHPLYGLGTHAHRHSYPWGTPLKAIHRGPNHTSGPLAGVYVTLLTSWMKICARTGHLCFGLHTQMHMHTHTHAHTCTHVPHLVHC